jgi:hypothetical protein
LEAIVLGAVAGTVCSWLFNYFSRRDEHTLRIRSENTIKANEQALRSDVEHAIKTHEAHLRVLVEREVQKARGEVERELKSHEIRLRVEADIRLRFIDRILTDVGQYRTKLVTAFNSIYFMTQEAEPRGATPKLGELAEDAKRAFAAVPASGAYIPPELLSEAIALFDEAHECFRNVVEWAILPTRAERTPRCLETNGRIESIAARSRDLFGAWQSKQFAILRAGTEELAARNDPAPVDSTGR